MVVEQRRAVVALALISSFMVFADGTIVNLALAPLATHLHASRAELSWAVDAYTLSFAAVMLGAGALTDALGARRAFVTGLVVFTAASAICALAASMTVLNLARLVQGAGAALLLPSALVLATAAGEDEAARARLLGRWAAAGGMGMAAGPLLGGVLVALIDWRAAFAVNVAIGVPALVWSLRAMPAVPGRPRRPDLAGMGTATVATGGLVFALIEAPTRGWSDPAVAGALGLAVAGLLGFVVVERTVRAPLLPGAVYADGRFAFAAGQGALSNFAFYGLLFALSLMLQQGRGLGPLTSGLLFLPLTGLLSLGGLSAAPLTQRFGRRVVMACAQATLAVTLLAVAWASTATALWPLVIALLPVGLSSGVLVPTMTAQAIAPVAPALHGAASAAFNTARQIGGAIGVATFGPLLGTVGDLGDGFTTCVAVAAAAIAGALLLTGAGAVAGAARRPEPECAVKP
jgi:MFS transporter, DHA2 family, methylenomycin A resistance protein